MTTVYLKAIILYYNFLLLDVAYSFHDLRPSPLEATPPPEENEEATLELTLEYEHARGGPDSIPGLIPSVLWSESQSNLGLIPRPCPGTMYCNCRCFPPCSR